MLPEFEVVRKTHGLAGVQIRNRYRLFLTFKTHDMPAGEK
jgi:hypothetical protein